jgi:iron complex outermembrane receptor protein
MIKSHLLSGSSKFAWNAETHPCAGIAVRFSGALLCATALAVPLAAQAQDTSGPMITSADRSVSEDDNDVIVVTGTYLRSDFPPSSPVDVISEEIFETRPQQSIAAALFELPYVVGGSGGQNGGQTSSNINLRGLGADATLVLLNGRRQVRVPTTSSVIDVNTMVPQIMVSGIEILKDGASALYGSDAVAGVVNLRTDNNFEGFAVEAEGRWYTDSAERRNVTPYLAETPGNYRAAAKLGIGSDRGHLVVAAEYARRDRIGTSGLPQVGARPALVPIPGQLTRNLRNAAGVLTNARVTIRDPNCGQIPSTSPAGSNCMYSFNEDQTYLSGQERIQTFVRGEYEFSDSLRFVAEAGYAHQDSTLSETASPSLSVSPSLIVPGDSPAVQALGNGSLFRAVNSNGALLYAQADANDPARPARDANGRVIVTGTDPAGGIPFWEDVAFSGRVILSQGGLPTGGSLIPGEYAHANATTDTDDVFRLALGFEGTLPISEGFNWSAFYTHASYDSDQESRDVFPIQLRQALAGYAGNNCNPLTNSPGEGPCSYFNPFIASALVSPTSAAANSQATIDYFYKTITSRFRTVLDVVDVVVDGSLFSLPAGDVSIALGGQYRREAWTADFAENLEIGNTANGAVSSDIDSNQEVWSSFGEIGIPVIDGSMGSLDLNGALRYEKSDAFSTVDPKVGATYVSPGGLVTLRGTWGQSFLSPNLFQQFTQSAGLANVTSTYGGTTPSTIQPRIATIQTGNPNLLPQRAEAWNAGIAINPIDRLTLRVDRWHFKFDGLITTQNPQTLVNEDDASVAAGNGPTGKVIRDGSGNVIQVLTTFFNAAALTTSGYDFQLGYSHDLGDLGSLQFSANATYVDKYSYQASATGPALDLAGNYNATNRSVNPSVKFRAVFDLGWTLDAHQLRAHVIHTGGMKNDQANASIAGDDRYSPFTTLDLSYSYTLENFMGAETSIAAGVSNVLNSQPEHVSAFGSGTATGVYDYLGRSLWIRLGVTY